MSHKPDGRYIYVTPNIYSKDKDDHRQFYVQKGKNICGRCRLQSVVLYLLFEKKGGKIWFPKELYCIFPKI